MNRIKAYMLAARIRTLPAAIAPVIVGSAIAYRNESFKLFSAFIVAVCALLIQIGTNYVNDLFDHLSGKDTQKRKGPSRAVANGIISVKGMRIAIAAIFISVFIIGQYLVYIAGIWILIIGVLSIIAGILYTAGPFPLAYNGLGDIFVFLFFGIIAVNGTFYVQSGEINSLSFAASIPVGALITNILIVNNYRDVEEDSETGKKTLAVIFGARFAQLEYIFFLFISFAAPLIFFFVWYKSYYILLPILIYPVGISLAVKMFRHKGQELNKTLSQTALFSAIYSLLFSLGFIL